MDDPDCRHSPVSGPSVVRTPLGSAGELHQVVAEVATLEIVTTGAALHDAEELEELVVARIAGRPTVVDEDLEPNLTRVAEQHLPVRAVPLLVSGGEHQDSESPVAVVGDLVVLERAR